MCMFVCVVRRSDSFLSFYYGVVCVWCVETHHLHDHVLTMSPRFTFPVLLHVFIVPLDTKVCVCRSEC